MVEVRPGDLFVRLATQSPVEDAPTVYCTWREALLLALAVDVDKGRVTCLISIAGNVSIVSLNVRGFTAVRFPSDPAWFPVSDLTSEQVAALSGPMGDFDAP